MSGATESDDRRVPDVDVDVEEEDDVHKDAFMLFDLEL
jgi:hypothetical protein